jgi:uncharacterized delta-60 repeat protein
MRPLRFIAVMLALLPGIVKSQTLDPNFIPPVPLAKAAISVVKIQPDGKILLGGLIDFYEEQSHHTLIRLNTDGSLDNTFNYAGGEKDLAAIDVQLKDNGQIVLTDSKYVYTLDSDGQIANTFVKVGVDYEEIRLIKLQPDGKVLVSGTKAPGGDFLRRHNEDGTIDQTFDFTQSLYISNIELQNTDIIISHSFGSYMKLDNTGTVDPSFAPGPFNGYPINFTGLGGLTVQPDGKIIRYYNDPANYRYNLETKDMFRHSGSGVGEEVFDEVTGPVVGIRFVDDMIYIQLLTENIISYTAPSQIIRLNQDGTRDNTFAPVTCTFRRSASSFDVGSDGSVVVANSKFGNTFGINRYDATGGQITSFTPELSMYGSIAAVRIRDDQQLLVAGKFIKLGDHFTQHVGLLMPDGSPNETFAVTVDRGSAFIAEFTADDAVIVSTEDDLFKVDLTGAIDPSFAFQRVDDLYQVSKLTILPNGKMVAIGPNNIYRLLSDGSLDPTFESGTGGDGPNGGNPDFDVQDDGKILYASISTDWNGTPTPPLIRINEDGTLDTTFPISEYVNPNAFTRQVMTTPSGGIFLQGDLISYDGIPVTNGLIKINANGSLDDTFFDNYESLSYLYPKFLRKDPAGLLRILWRYLEDGSLGGDLQLINPDGTLNQEFLIPAELSLGDIQDVASNESSIIVSGNHTLNGNPIFITRLLRTLPVVQITGNTIEEVAEETPFELLPEHIIMTGLANTPGLSVVISPGTNYTVDGNVVTPAENFNGQLTIGISIQDATEELASGTIMIQVTPVNDPPVITAVQNISITEDTPTTLVFSQIIFTDVDTSPADLSIVIIDRDNYSVSGTTITPDLNFNGPLSITIKLKDGAEYSNDFIFTIPVTAVNDKPVITAVQNISITEDTPTTLSLSHVTFTDVDTSPTDLSIVIVNRDNYSVDGSTITPGLNFNGPLSITIKLKDGTDYSNDFIFTIPVTAVNDKPVITAVQNISITEDTPASLSLSQITYTDVDTSPANLSVVTIDGDHYSVSGNSIIPDLNFNGPLSITIRLKDGAIESEPFSFNATVNAANDPPVIISAANNIKCSAASPLTLLAAMFKITDPDNTTAFTVTPVLSAGYDIVNGTIVPHSLGEGKLMVSATASDGQLTSAVFVFEVHVLPVVVTTLIREPHFSVWPNPATNFLNHEFTNAEVKLTDLSGKVLATDELKTGTIEISHLTPGLYLLEVVDGSGKRSVFRVVKQ